MLLSICPSRKGYAVLFLRCGRIVAGHGIISLLTEEFIQLIYGNSVTARCLYVLLDLSFVMAAFISSTGILR